MTCVEALTALLLLMDHFKSWNNVENSVIKPLVSLWNGVLLCLWFSPAVSLIPISRSFCSVDSYSLLQSELFLPIYFCLFPTSYSSGLHIWWFVFSFSSNAPTVLSCQGLYMHFVLKVIYTHSELCVMSDFSSSNSNNSLFILQSDGRNC